VVEQFLWDPPATTPPEGRDEPLADTFVASYLLEHGARKVELGVKEVFAAACNRREAWRGERAPLRLMAELAAWKRNLEMVKLLVELGSDPGLREPSYNRTPLDWAAHNQQDHVVQYLAKLDRP
jgi:hypothetical protein